MHGVDFRVDPAWVDREMVPSQSPAYPHDGVSPDHQQAWMQIRDDGFNFLRVPVDVTGGPEQVRLAANLCIWARTQDVMLVPVLNAGPPESPVSESFAVQAGQFISDLVAALNQAGSDHIQAYQQVVMYQLGDTPNHPARTGGLGLDAVAANVVSAAASVREAETASLSAHGMSPRPILVEGSFDAALVEAGGVWGAALTEENFNLAFERFNEFASMIAASPNVDVLGLSWYPGSVSTGGAEQFPTLVDALSQTYPGMQILVATGYSTAFSTADEQRGYHDRVIQNLGDYYDAAGEQSLLLGVVVTEAFDAVRAEAGPPGAESYIQSWDPISANAELLKLWQGQPADPTVAWWAGQTAGRMGLLQAPETAAAAPQPAPGGSSTPEPPPEPGDAAQPEPETTASAGTGTGEPPPAPGDPEASPSGASGGGAGGLEDLSKTLQGIFEKAVVDVTEDAVEGITGKVEQIWKGKEEEAPAVEAGPPQGYGQTAGSDPGDGGQGVPESAVEPAVPSGAGVVIESASPSSPAPMVGEPLVVHAVVANSGGETAGGLIAALVDPEDYLIADEAIREGLSVPAQGAQSVELQWTPLEPGPREVAFKLYDSNYLEVTGVSLGAIDVSPAVAADQSGAVPRSISLDTPLARSRLKTVRIGYPKASTPTVRVVNGKAEVALTVANPTARAMPAFDAVLVADGQGVETIAVEDLLPHASRSLAFAPLSGYTSPDGLRVNLQRPGESAMELAVVEPEPLKVEARRQAVLLRPVIAPASTPAKTTAQPVLKRASPSSSEKPAVRLKLPQAGTSQTESVRQGTTRLKVAPAASD